jgi:hypothetical protein
VDGDPGKLTGVQGLPPSGTPFSLSREQKVVSEDFLRQLAGYGLTTAEIFYRSAFGACGAFGLIKPLELRLIATEYAIN